MHPAHIFQSFLAIATGFFTMAIVVMLATAILDRFAPDFVQRDTRPRTTYMLLNLATSAAAALLGGWLTALVAPAHPLTHALVLAMVVLVMSALSALDSKGRQPMSYLAALTVLSPVCTLAGGLLRLHQLGYHWS